MFVRGQLVLSINLKKKPEVYKAINLLNSLVMEDTIEEIKKSLSAGTWVASSNLEPTVTTEQIEDAAKKIKLKQIPKTIEGKEALLNALDPKEFRKYYRASYKNGKGVTVEQAKTSQKLREKALLRKRDKQGHFLPGKVSKK